MLRVIAIALVLAASPRAAHADADDEAGGWLWLEYRQPIYSRPPRVPRLAMRVISDTRLSARSPVALAQQFLRVGLWFEPTNWMIVATNGTVYADRLADGRFAAEARLEQEVYFQHTIARRLWIMNRNRVEWRYRDNEDAKLRFRTLLRVQYQAPGRVRPFVWNEWLFDSRAGFSEDRFVVGLNFLLMKTGVNLDVAYMLRQRKVAEDWPRDHVLLLNLVVPVAPVVAMR